MSGVGCQSTAADTSRQPVGHPTSGRPRTIGPCFQCAQWGHLQKDCPQMTRVYPFTCVVNSAYTTCSNMYGVAVHDASSDVWDSNIVCTTLPEGEDSIIPSIREAGTIHEASTIHEAGNIDSCGKDCMGPQEIKPVELLMTVAHGQPTPLVVDNRDDNLGGTYEPIDPALLPLDDQMSIRCWELDQTAKDTRSQICDVQGRLKAVAQYWLTTLHATSPVLDWVQEGYKLPLLTLPPAFSQTNHKSAIQHKTFCHSSCKGAPRLSLCQGSGLLAIHM